MVLLGNRRFNFGPKSAFQIGPIGENRRFNFGPPFTVRDAFTRKRNVLLAIFRLPEVPMLPRSFLNAFTVNFASFEVQLR